MSDPVLTETPEVAEGILSEAEWWAANQARYWRALYRLRAYVTENGPIPLPSGKVVSFYADGFSWEAAAVAQEFPALISAVEATITGSKLDVEWALSVVLEEVPALRIAAVKHVVDKDAATGMLRAGGAASERLKTLRVEKSKLGCR
jgi:hypothetical protein